MQINGSVHQLITLFNYKENTHLKIINLFKYKYLNAIILLIYLGHVLMIM
jgi:hypothetical protein